MWTRRLLIPAAGLMLGGAVTAAPAAASAPARAGACSPSASLLGFSDALDKTEFGGTAVSGLSAIAVTRPGRALALVDNIGTSPARMYGLSLRPRLFGGLHVAARDVTTLKRPDGTPYTGADLDGEGLVAERGGRTVLVSSETEPSIRRFGAHDGRQRAELPVPERFRVAPAGEAVRNQTFEALAATPDGRTLYAGMEGSLSADASGVNRVLRYDRGRDYRPAAQYAYTPDAGLGLVELVALRDGGLLALERGWTSGVGNTVRVYATSTRGAQDVSDVASLAADSPAVLRKRLLVDLADCPPSGATAKQPQPNPLLDNVEGMALGGRTWGGRVLYLVSDDNGGATQITRAYALKVRVRA
ncbi:esterase-like activity of phytase family protein [Actinomadura sp. WMMB 499]|uniref:esterase-like activity of phytase family protein n=1 Tax=Actinomadura sp. WMMB 499 TaxID=1219491 RepID=UPI0012481242|nr:esterase-like activity of phytase family protein [Actinomadura sp. WMMB 499]QFG21613.1 esterase-like activity of phytase family protein [Actinomadura sp. WMMB 499]